MHPLLARYDAHRLTALSRDRRRTTLRVLRELDAGCCLPHIDATAMRSVLDRCVAAGHGPSTIRKDRAIMLAFCTWSWQEGHINGDTLLKLRAIRPTAGSSHRAQPHPYRPGELRELGRILDESWPRLPEDEARRWSQRWRDVKSPYSRIRHHAIRLQLDAVIGLALRCGLRRDEIFRVDVDAIHPDNAYIVVSGERGSRKTQRTVPYTDSARTAIAPWCRLRRKIGLAHQSTWLNLSSAGTVREPMTRHTFDRLLRTYVGEGWTLRRLRATCIVNWIRAGLPLEHLRGVLGYGDIAELLPYARCVGGDVGRKMDRLDATFSESIGVAPAAA